MATNDQSSLSRSDVTRIIEHMNDEHEDALLLYAEYFGGVDSATAARMVALETEYMELEVDTPEGTRTVPFQLIEDVHDATEARKVLVRMAQIARQGGPEER